jgi:hypothetical protein
VSFRNGSGLKAAVTVLEARKNVGISNAASSKPPPDNSQVIRVTLTGACAKPLGIGPGFIGPKDARLRGYKISQFEEAFSRYLPQEVCSTVHNAANTGNGGERGLSSRRIQELADLRSEQAYWKFSPADIAAGKLDAWLRDILRKEAPERIELEFERVMQVVRGAR